MKIQPYIEKLSASQEYKEFNKKYSDAFLVAGFFVLDLELGKNIHQIDFYIPSQKKFAAFTLDEGVNFQLLDSMIDKAPEELDMKTKIDLDALQGILEDEMKNRNITEDIKKIIAVIQNINGKKVWNLNCVLSGMEILKAHVEDSSKTVLKMEKVSFVEIMKKMPMGQMQMPSAMQNQNQGQTEESQEEVEEELDKLEKIGEEIQKQKQILKKEVAKKEKAKSNNSAKDKAKK